MKITARYGKISLLLMAIFFAPIAASAQDSEKAPTAEATKIAGSANPWHRSYSANSISTAPKIDGKLDDTVWKSADFSSDFLQRDPDEGVPETEKTEFAMAYDDDNLYIAARMFDVSPELIRSTEMRRDAYLWDDDHIEIILDTFDDKRSSFYFKTNALGVRIDGKVNDEGKNNNRNWDGVWSSKTSIDDKGWYAEIAIPWQTLRFKEGENVEWNVNLIRMIRRKNEYDYWRLVNREHGRNGKYKTSQAGRVTGFQNLKMGGKYEFLPYVTGGLAKDATTDYKLINLKDMGLDAKWNISTTVTADFTLNTDFAQVEADQEKVNLTRFPLFFPEKREFFLEGAESFSFGQSGGGMMRRGASPIQLFHSRTIGLEEGYKVPIIGGARVQGKSGDYTFGLISVQTNSEFIDDVSIQQTNHSVFRLKRDLFSRSSVGIMMLNRQENDTYNRAVGFDSYFPITNTFSFYTVGAGTFGKNIEGEENRNKNNYAANLGFNYDSDLWSYSLTHLDIAKEFRPEMGYVQRRDIRKTKARMSYKPRPKRWESMRQISFSLNGEYQSNHSGLQLDKEVETSVNFNFADGSKISFNAQKRIEFLDSNWEVRTNNFIPIGTYTANTFRASYNTSRANSLSGRFNLFGGGYYSGTKYGGSASMDFNAFNKFRGALDYSYNWVDLPDGEFHTNSLSSRLSWSFSPDFFVKAYLQLLDDKLRNEDMYVMSSNVLLHYIYRPGSDFFLVFSEGRSVGAGNEVINNRTVLSKFTYFFRQ